MRTLLVDDERLARAELRRLLAPHSQVEIVGEAANVAEARALVEGLKPQLLLLDIRMPDGTGFDLLESLDAAPEVIFTTAYDAYAMKAFEVNALDYLQKPIDAGRLAAALERAATRLATAPAAPLNPSHRIFLKDGDRCWFVAVGEISLFESEGNYTRVHFEGQQPLVLRSLNQLEQRLDPRQFFRASRRHIVNLEFVARVTATESGGLTLLLRNDVSVDVSRRRAADFKALSAL